MRDPERIDPFLAAFGELWKQHPDMRFGQLFMNLVRDEEGDFLDPWEWEEDEFLSRIEGYDAYARDHNARVMTELEENIKGIPGGLELLKRLREEMEADGS